jgi:hypothetical protein
MIARQYRDEMVRLVKTVMDEIGPRESCGAAEHRLGETLRRRWSELGLAVQEEPFRCHPRALTLEIEAGALDDRSGDGV